MAKGGKRIGAGRPKGYAAIEAEKAREYIVKRVSDELAPIMDKAIEQAKAGDVSTRRDLLDRAYGKPKETVEVQGFDFIFANDEK